MEDSEVAKENFKREGWKEQTQGNKEMGEVQKKGRLGIQAGNYPFTVFLLLSTWLQYLFIKFLFRFVFSLPEK